MAAGMVTGDGLTRQERYLVHQVHPVKLATDIGAAAVSTVLFWRHCCIEPEGVTKTRQGGGPASPEGAKKDSNRSIVPTICRV